MWKIIYLKNIKNKYVEDGVWQRCRRKIYMKDSKIRLYLKDVGKCGV